MNRYISSIIAAAIIAAAATGVSAQNDKNDRSPIFSTVVNPVIPQKTEFCGRTVDLTRADMYERLDRELTSIIYTHGNTLLAIKRANKYFPVIAPILKANNIPLDFLYLAVVESTLNQRAYSGAKAAGIWQFIAPTAKQYGLEVSDEVDERYNLEKATAAACRYFKKAYQKYGNWESVMASYNGGMSRISTELDKQYVSSAFDLYLTDETSRYPFRVMAQKLLMENPEAYGYKISSDQLYRPVECDIVTVSGPVEDWPAWAKQHGITYAQLREENPWIRAKSLTNKAGKTYKVRVPKKGALIRDNQPKTVFKVK